MTRRRLAVAFAVLAAAFALIGLARRARLRARAPRFPRSPYAASDALLDESYVTVPSLAEARTLAHTAVVMRGDRGGQVYLTVPVRYVGCPEGALHGLLAAIDALEWNDRDAATLAFELAPAGSGIFGGMGGGNVVEGVWVHPRLERAGLLGPAAAVVYGRQTLDQVIGEFPRALPPPGDGEPR